MGFLGGILSGFSDAAYEDTLMRDRKKAQRDRDMRGILAQLAGDESVLPSVRQRATQILLDPKAKLDKMRLGDIVGEGQDRSPAQPPQFPAPPMPEGAAVPPPTLPAPPMPARPAGSIRYTPTEETEMMRSRIGAEASAQYEAKSEAEAKDRQRRIGELVAGGVSRRDAAQQVSGLRRRVPDEVTKKDESSPTGWSKFYIDPDTQEEIGKVAGVNPPRAQQIRSGWTQDAESSTGYAMVTVDPTTGEELAHIRNLQPPTSIVGTITSGEITVVTDRGIERFPYTTVRTPRTSGIPVPPTGGAAPAGTKPTRARIPVPPNGEQRQALSPSRSAGGGRLIAQPPLTADQKRRLDAIKNSRELMTGLRERLREYLVARQAGDMEKATRKWVLFISKARPASRNVGRALGEVGVFTTQDEEAFTNMLLGPFGRTGTVITPGLTEDALKDAQEFMESMIRTKAGDIPGIQETSVQKTGEAEYEWRDGRLVRTK